MAENRGRKNVEGPPRTEEVVTVKGNKRRSLDYSIFAKIIVQMSQNVANNTFCG